MTITGLPLHPLVIHAVVVLLPLMALLTVLVAVRKSLRSGDDLLGAVRGAVEQFVSIFTNMGGLMAERVTDLRDIERRVIAHLVGEPPPGVPTPTAALMMPRPSDPTRSTSRAKIGSIAVAPPSRTANRSRLIAPRTRRFWRT